MKVKFLFLILLILVSTGCNRSQEPLPPPAVPEVATLTVTTQPVVLTTELPGRTSAFLVAEIRPQVNGLIQKRLFTEGADIAAGDELYQIDPAPYQAALDNALANLSATEKAASSARAGLEVALANVARQNAVLDLARANAKRNQELFREGASTASQVDEIVAAVKEAEAALRAAEAQVTSNREAVAAADAAIQQSNAALEMARINLAYTKITSPISGRIGRSEVTEGAIVTAYQPFPLATVQQYDPIYVDVPQSTVELRRLKQSLASGHLKEGGTDKVKIVLEDGTLYPLEGSLKFRDVTVDPSTNSVILRIVVPNPDLVFLPGMFVKAVIEEGVREEAILIPQEAVRRDPKGNPVALVVDAEGKVQEKSIRLDRAIGNQWLVSSGLVPGDHLIIEGGQKARPDATVKEVPFEPVPEGTGAPESDPQSVAYSS
jgi:membrane fusion protein (multidrug efflux system)